MGRRRHLEPFECEIVELGPRGQGRGTAPDGREVLVRGAPPGSRVVVVPAGRKKGAWLGRRLAMIRPPAAWVRPRCAQFGACGGCTLQELSLDAQRRHKQAVAVRVVADGLGGLHGVRVHPVRGAPAAYAYRNKVELSFGPTQWVSEIAKAEGAGLDGRFLGFHAPGRFDRIVDAPRCELISEAMNRVLQAVRAVALHPDAPAPYHAREHRGFWRHLLLREAGDEILAVVYSTSPGPGDEAAVQALADAVGPLVVGVEWRINDGVADVARGDVVRTWGRPWMEARLGSVGLRVGAEAFLQTNSAGAVVLYDTVAEVLGRGGPLLDLYCGAGAIGLYLAQRFDEVVGIEEREAAVEDARANAARNGVSATFVAARVEDVLDDVTERFGAHVRVVVDPPRAGLHPKVARALAGAEVAALVYVACNPASLARDGAILLEGGWRLTDLHTVDLFPQTGHIEMVGAFTR